MKINIKNCKNPSCIYCQKKYDFDLPEHLLEEFFKGDVVIFAGSGISTESNYVLPITFYEVIANELGYKNCTKPFSELMEEYCSQPNGKRELLFQIKSRFDNIKSFPELYNIATKFHKELATLPQAKTIITTNWDTYFEDECGAVSFMYPEDFAFWDTDERKVLKIHGSINNFGSIIASKSDYDKCLEDLHKNVIGSVLKTILATKTVVFIGYSFSDEDFQQIYSFVCEEMNGFSRQAYIVTLDKDNLDKFKNYNLIPIVTDGTYFISIIKGYSVHNHRSLPDDLYDFASILCKKLWYAHNKLCEGYNVVQNPEIIYCGYYQDGAIHAFERISALRNKGKYSCECEFLNTIDVYKKLRKDYLRNKRYGDVAYIDGYVNAHKLLFVLLKLPEKKPKMPLFYAYGYEGEIFTFKDYKKIFKRIPKLNKSAYRNAERIVKKHDKGGEFVLHHPAYL